MEKNNKIIGNPKLDNTVINFKGSNNIIYCEENVVIKNSHITFCGNNSIVYLSSNRHIYYFQVTIYNDSVLYFGKNNYMNKSLHIILSEQKHVIIGEECLFAIGSWIRTADPHIIYDAHTLNRINPSKSVFIGDHVWCGQNVLILKGSAVGSGCIIGGGTVVSGKRLFSNTVYGGNPAKNIKENVFHSKKSVNAFTELETEKYSKFIDDRYVYNNTSDKINYFQKIEDDINTLKNCENRLEYLKQISNVLTNKNRFYIGY